MDEKERILIIDDDAPTCRSLALILGKKGYETTGKRHRLPRRRFSVRDGGLSMRWSSESNRWLRLQRV